MTEIHPATAALIDLFGWHEVDAATRERIQGVRDEYQTMAEWVVRHTPGGPEQTVALRDLLSSKDCAVRAIIAASE